MTTTWRQRHFFHAGPFSRDTPRIRNRHTNHSADWIRRQITDRYVRLAQEQNFRSRAAFKLLQLDDKFLFFRRGQVVLDLGSYPGGWSQVACQRVWTNPSSLECAHVALVVGVDKIAMEPMPNHHFILGDIGGDGQDQLLHKIQQLCQHRKADVVLSDMSPACIGIKQDDHLGCADLCLKALDLAEQMLRLGGSFVVKMFMGSQSENYKVLLHSRFTNVKAARPRACRNESREMYFVCRDFIGRPRLSEEVQVKGAFSTREGYY